MRAIQQTIGDGLCGFMAVRNAVNAVHNLDPDDEATQTALVAAIWQAIPDKWQITSDGSERPELIRMLGAANAVLIAKGLGRVRWTTPFDDDTPDTAAEFWMRLDRHTRAENAAAIIGLGEPLNHWSVQLTPGAKLFDSAGVPTLKRAGCIVEGERRKGQIICPTDTIILIAEAE